MNYSILTLDELMRAAEEENNALALAVIEKHGQFISDNEVSTGELDQLKEEVNDLENDVNQLEKENEKLAEKIIELEEKLNENIT